MARIALALADRAGARLAHLFGMSAGRDTLLRLIRALPDPDRPTPRVLGVHDFAFRRVIWSRPKGTPEELAAHEAARSEG